MKDKTEKSEIVVGSYIVYGHALGRCAGLKFGRVVKIDTYNDYFRYWVIGVDDDWYPRNNAQLSKMGRLQFEDRIIVLPFEMLPIYAQELLRDINATK
jgi:hypothetical protein